MKSLSLIIPANKRADCNKLMEALGRGPNTFSVDCSPSGARAETHTGCHTYDDELLAIVETKTLPGGIVWTDYGLTASSAQQALNAIRYRAEPNRHSVSNFKGLCTAEGVKLIQGDE